MRVTMLQTSTRSTAYREASSVPRRIAPPHRTIHRTDADDARFFAKVDMSGECWIWKAFVNKQGYGRFHYGSGSNAILAHRYLVEARPEDDYDHLCRVTACVRPDHLEKVTHAENMRRGYFAMKTHCPAGHPYDEENTYFNKRGHRFCRECSRERGRRDYWRRRTNLKLSRD